jgi:hypothetical protein
MRGFTLELERTPDILFPGLQLHVRKELVVGFAAVVGKLITEMH